MRYVDELHGAHAGEDIYVVGTGTSMRVFPLELLEGKVTIGLNIAWKYMTPTYGLTQRPELNIPEFMGEQPRPSIRWITKYGKLLTDEQRQFAEENSDRFFYFESHGRRSWVGPDKPSETGRVLDWVREPSGRNLYVWSSISQTAANLAANMGARNVILVGCDNCSLLDNHHAHQQHTMWKGEDPDVRYDQYYEGLAEVREALRERGVNVVSVTPFMGLAAPERDFERLCEELGVPKVIENEEVLTKPPTLRDRARHFARVARRGV